MAQSLIYVSKIITSNATAFYARNVRQFPLSPPLGAIMSIPPYKLFAIGDPLLDLQITNGEELLKKYDLKANNAIRAEEKHASMYEHRVNATP